MNVIQNVQKHVSIVNRQTFETAGDCTKNVRASVSTGHFSVTACECTLKLTEVLLSFHDDTTDFF